jgi:uncharacterized protein (TIGR02996 family)
MYEDFTNALSEKQNDNVTRLVYADWLDEQDDPRAEFLRLEVRLATEEVSDDQRRAMLNRLAGLGRCAEPRWLCGVNRSPFIQCGVRKLSGGDPRHGKIELANYATHALLIRFDASFLQYLRLRITDPLGAISDEWFDEFPVLATRGHAHRLEAANKLSLTVNLLNTIPADQITVGAYTVEARYEYDGVVSRADPVLVALSDEDRRKWRLGRFARA